MQKMKDSFKSARRHKRRNTTINSAMELGMSDDKASKQAMPDQRQPACFALRYPPNLSSFDAKMLVLRTHSAMKSALWLFPGGGPKGGRRMRRPQSQRGVRWPRSLSKELLRRKDISGPPSAAR